MEWRAYNCEHFLKLWHSLLRPHLQIFILYEVSAVTARMAPILMEIIVQSYEKDPKFLKGYVSYFSSLDI